MLAALPIGATGAAKAPDIGAKARRPPQSAAAAKVSFILLMGISSIDAPLTRDAAGSFRRDLANLLNFHSDIKSL